MKSLLIWLRSTTKEEDMDGNATFDEFARKYGWTGDMERERGFFLLGWNAREREYLAEKHREALAEEDKFFRENPMYNDAGDGEEEDQ